MGTLVQPAAGVGAACGNGARPANPAGMVELQTERRRERRRVGRRDVVGRHAATGAEVAEVERRSVDRAAAPAGPLDLGDLLAAALGRLGERLGLQHAGAGAERRVRVAERLAVDVERVVRRAMDARPRAGVSVNQPAPVFGGDCVSSPLSDALAPCFSRSRKPGTTPCFGVRLDGVLAHAIGREEQQLARRGPGHGRRGWPRAGQPRLRPMARRDRPSPSPPAQPTRASSSHALQSPNTQMWQTYGLWEAACDRRVTWLT